MKATDRLAHETKNEVEITPQMVEAGEDVLYGRLGAEVSGIAPELAREVYLAMIRSRETKHCPSSTQNHAA